MQLNDKLRTLRELNDFSQEDMADKLQMSTNGYAKIERGERRLDIPKLEQIVAIFGMDLMEFINFDVNRAVNLIHENKQSIIYQINKNSQQNTYFGSEDLQHEIEKLNLIISHKDELLVQKERELNQITEQKQREIDLLQELVNTLKQR